MAERRTPGPALPDLFSGLPPVETGRIVTGVILDRPDNSARSPGPAATLRVRRSAPTWDEDAGEPGGPDDRLLPWPDVQKLVGFSRTTAWRMQRAGLFPRPIPVSPGRVGWWESQLNAWKRARRGAEPVTVRAPGSGRGLRPPSAPRFPGMPRQTSSPAGGGAAARSSAVATRSPPPPLPLPPPKSPVQTIGKPRRRRGPDPAQTDFGF